MKLNFQLTNEIGENHFEIEKDGRLCRLVVYRKTAGSVNALYIILTGWKTPMDIKADIKKLETTLCGIKTSLDSVWLNGNYRVKAKICRNCEHHSYMGSKHRCMIHKRGIVHPEDTCELYKQEEE